MSIHCLIDLFLSEYHIFSFDIGNQFAFFLFIVADEIFELEEAEEFLVEGIFRVD